MFLKLVQLFSFFIGGIIVSYSINKLLLSFSQTFGIRNKNDVVVRWSNQSKPSLGGISFFLVFIFTAIGYSIIFSDEIIFHNVKYVGLFLASCLAFLMGLADDAYNTKPLIKLVVQILCGLIFVVTNNSIDLTHSYWIDSTLTIIWVITLMNSLNMLDNMDGISGTTSALILLACLLSFYLVFDINRNIWSILIVAQIGALIGFLILNVHPSKMFMGDSGSQFIGLFVAFFSINHLWNIGQITGAPSWVGMLTCLVTLTPAAADTLTVVINRLKKGKSPMVGGKDHTTHHLVYAGFNDRQVWYIFVLIGFLSAALSFLMVYLCKLELYAAVAVCALFFPIVFFLLYRLTIKYGPDKRKIKN